MRQRLGVARCLLADPELLILDEPTNGLDPAGILEFRQMIRALVGEGRTVFLSSHLLDEVEKTCDAAAIIDGGRIVTSRPDRGARAQPPRRADLDCDDPDRALELLAGDARACCDAQRPAEGLRAARCGRRTPPPQSTACSSRPASTYRASSRCTSSLEERFLEVTSRLESVA